MTAMKRIAIAAVLSLAAAAAHAEAPPALISSLFDPCSLLTAAEAQTDPAYKHIDLAFISGASQAEEISEEAMGSRFTRDSATNGEAYATTLAYCYAHPTASVGQGIAAFINSITAPKQ
jgi:hypothetical protein